MDRKVAEPGCAEAGDITFLGRGLARRLGGRLLLVVCPLCSQRNGRRGREAWMCEWCAYVPSMGDAQPCPTES